MKKIVLAIIISCVGFGVSNTYAQVSNKKKKAKDKKEVKNKNGDKEGIQPYEKVIKKSSVSLLSTQDLIRSTISSVETISLFGLCPHLF